MPKLFSFVLLYLYYILEVLETIYYIFILESFVTSSHKLIHSHGGIVDEIKDNADRAIQNISDAIPACPGYTKQITHKFLLFH